MNNSTLFLAIEPWAWIGLAVIAVVGLIFLLIIGQYVQLWLQAWLSGAPVSLLDLIMMRLRKVNPSLIVLNRISAKKTGLEISTQSMEAHFLAGGRVTNVVRAMIAAEKAGIELPWDRAVAIDLAGRDIVDAVNTSVMPKVIDCPNPASGKQTIDAVAKDGIQLRAKARVTVRTNISRLVGGATEETIIARVGEGIISTIGSALDIGFPKPFWPKDSILEPLSKFSLLILPMWMSEKISAHNFKQRRPKQTQSVIKPKQNNAERSQLLKKQSITPKHRRIVQSSFLRKPKFLGQLQSLSEMDILA